MKRKVQTSKNLIGKITGAFLFVLYSSITFTSSFPAFHSHNLEPRSCNCCYEDSCGFEEYGYGETIKILSTTDHHDFGVCLACMWQALGQLYSVFDGQPQIISELINSDKPLSKDLLSSRDLMCNPAIRAPPLS